RCLSHSPYPVPSYNTSFPYIEFGRYCDVVMPQDYWYDQFASSGGKTPQAMADLMNSDWNYWQGVWQGEGDGSSVKPLAPIGQGFQGASPVPIPGSQLTAFLNELNIENPPATAGGYKGISFWVCDQHTSDEWAAIGAMSIGSINSHINPCTARTSDGRLEVFAVGHSGFLYHNYQTSPGGSWSGWVAMGTSGNVWAQNGLPAVGVNADGRLEVFITGTDGTINHIYQKTAGSSATTNWSSFATLISSHVSQTAKLTVGKWSNGVMDLFVIGTDGALYHVNQTAPNAGWGSWNSLGGTWSQDADIAIGNDLNGEEDVFVIGNTGNLYNNWQTAVNGASWHGWNDIGGTLNETARTALGRNSDGRLEFFTLGTDGVSYHNWETSANGQTAWNGWASLGGNWEADAKTVVASDQNGALEVFLIGKTGNLYHNYQSGSWTGWLSLTGSFSQNIRPCVGMNSSGKMEVFLTGPSSDILTATESAANSGTWSAFSSLGGSWN
ncbi:MAG TPA: hypothetical protein VFC07_10340, partial [Verrucomicrobiae bacterium]|nr:hypothetical protein [Verrucomicrobiae bacterium]